MKSLILFVAFMLIGPNALAAIPYIGISDIPNPVPKIECEFLLTDPHDAAMSMRWIADAVAPLTEPAPARKGFSPAPPALKILGLPEKLPADLAMKIEGPFGGGLYWVSVLSGALEMAKFPFHIPPVYVWKQVDNANDLDDIVLRFDLNKEDPKNISAGAVIGDFEQGRKFISIRRGSSEFVTVSLGVDVAIDLHGQYTHSGRHQIMAMPERDDFYSRIEVLTADFPIREWPPAAPPRGRVN